MLGRQKPKIPSVERVCFPVKNCCIKTENCPFIFKCLSRQSCVVRLQQFNADFKQIKFSFGRESLCTLHAGNKQINIKPSGAN